MFASVLHKAWPSLGQCKSLDLNSGVSVEASTWETLAWFSTETEMRVQGYFVVSNKVRTEHGPRRYQNVTSGAFVGVFRYGTSSLGQSSK